jgi:H+/gluconate symporter-like permease
MKSGIINFMYFAEDSMQGMNMTNTVVHPTAPPKMSFMTQLNNNIQKPSIAYPIVSITAIVLMLLGYWLLKRFTSWQFPINKKGSN